MEMISREKSVILNGGEPLIPFISRSSRAAVEGPSFY